MLKDERTGELVEFDNFREKDLPFLREDNAVGQQLKTAVIDADMDDDC